MSTNSLRASGVLNFANEPIATLTNKRHKFAMLMLCASLVTLTACSSAVADDGSQSAMGRGKGKLGPGKSTDQASGGTTTPTPLPTTTTLSVYDDSVGMGVTAGFASLPLRSGAHRYFVNSASGSDGNGCSGGQSATKPLKTIKAAYDCVAAGLGDQVLLAEGTSYAEVIPWLAYKSGYSAQYPTVIQSYDPADPSNEAKYGRGDQREARPVLTVAQTQVGNGAYANIAIRGLDFNPGNNPNVSLIFVGNFNNLLIENNLFRYTNLTLEGGTYTNSHHVVRGNSFYGQWNTTGRDGGLYVAGTDGVTVEDNVFWHNGWRIGGSRDAAITDGGASIFSHPFYIQSNTWNAILRRNLSVDGAGDGGIARGDITATENISIDNPICLGLGGGPDYNTARPNGVSIQASYNACLGDADVRSDHPAGWGISMSNGISGSSIHHNLIVRSAHPGGAYQGMTTTAWFDQPTYVDWHDNILYGWIVPGNGATHHEEGTYAATQIHATFNNNFWDTDPEGNNQNNSALKLPNPYTETQFYSALGYSGKDAFIAYAIEHPEVGWAAKIRPILFTGYGW